MRTPHDYEIPQGTIVLSINQKISHHAFTRETPLDTKLALALTQMKDRAKAFILLAEFASKMYHPPLSASTPKEQEWERRFGPFKLAPITRTHEHVRGTIIFPTSTETFLYELTGNELFIPEIERSFWKKENPAASLAFLAYFTVHMYSTKDIFETNLRLGWNSRF